MYFSDITSIIYISAYRFTFSKDYMHYTAFPFCWFQNGTPFNLKLSNLEACSDFELLGHVDSIYFKV